MGRKPTLIAVMCFFGGAWSWASYFRSRPVEKEPLWRDTWGWLSSGMEPHWSRFNADRNYHNLKNLGTEWARLESQRAYKCLAFLGCCLGGLGLIAGLLIGIALALI